MQYFLDLAKRVLDGHSPSPAEQKRLADLPCSQISRLFPGSAVLRRNFSGSTISVCSITNAKSGRCSEDCAFCAQSARYLSRTESYPLKDPLELADMGKRNAAMGVERFSVVTSGRGLSPDEVQNVATAVQDMAARGVHACASLGVLAKEQLDLLKKAGLKRYHHNLETAPGFFSRICTTHDFSLRVHTVRAAREAGLSVCSGAVFGLGESDAHVLELALVLKELDVDAVPVNFLVPVTGTPLENANYLSPYRCLKIIAILRYMLPHKEIIVCGGRMENLGVFHPLIFLAGASGVMTGNYLTRSGRSIKEDLQLIKDLGLVPE